MPSGTKLALEQLWIWKLTLHQVCGHRAHRESQYRYTTLN